MGRAAAEAAMDGGSSLTGALALAAAAGATTGAALYVASRWLSYHRNIQRAKGLPQVRQFVSHFSLLQAVLPKCLMRYDRAFYKTSVALFAAMDTPLLAFVSAGYLGVYVNEAHLFREICVTKRRAFPKAVKLYDVLRIFGENVVTTEGEVWRRHRAVAARAFSDANNRLVFETTLRSVGEMVAAWEAQAVAAGDCEKLEVEVLQDVTQMALAVITAAAFGFPIHAAYGKEARAQPVVAEGRSHRRHQQQQQRYQLSFTRCMEVVWQRTLAKVLLPAWALSLPVCGLREVGVAYREFNEHLLDVVDRERALQREERGRSAAGLGEDMGAESAGEDASALSSGSGGEQRGKGETLFRLLVQANEEGDGVEGSGAMATRGRRLEMGELLGNAFIFLLAGHETSSHALCFTLMLLALHPEEQQAVQAEVDAVLDVEEGTLGYEDLDRLVLCQGAMNESLRLFPPVVIVPKVAVQDGVEIASAQGRRFRIPEGAIVSLNVYALHRNPKHYPDPEAFRPARWDPSSPGYTPVDHFAFSPFSLGERSCIGRRFGQITVLTSLAMLLRDYDIRVPPGTDPATFLEAKPMLTLTPAHGARLIFTRRRHSSRRE